MDTSSLQLGSGRFPAKLRAEVVRSRSLQACWQSYALAASWFRQCLSLRKVHHVANQPEATSDTCLNSDACWAREASADTREPDFDDTWSSSDDSRIDDDMDFAIPYELDEPPQLVALASESGSLTTEDLNCHDIATLLEDDTDPLSVLHPLSGSPNAVLQTCCESGERQPRATPICSDCSAVAAGLVDAGVDLPSVTRRSSDASTSECLDNWINSEETLVFLDWDDTLCPTTWIDDNPRLYGWRCDPCLDDKDDEIMQIRSTLKRHELAVISFLRIAAAAGRVVIVTLASKSWVDTTIQHLFPKLATELNNLNIDVVYARTSLSKSRCDGAVLEGMKPWMPMKRAAMRKELKRFYSRRPCKSWKNCISIGDSFVERDALEDLTFTRSQFDQKGNYISVRCKTITLESEPTVHRLTQELEVLTRCFSILVHYDGDLRLNFDDLDEEGVCDCLGTQQAPG